MEPPEDEKTESKKAHWWDGSNPISYEDLLKKAECWTLGADAATATLLQQVSSRLISRTHEVVAALRDASEDATRVGVSVANLTTAFLLLSNTQFMENRVYCEGETDSTPVSPPQPESAASPPEETPLSTCQKAIAEGLAIVRQVYEKVEISDSESESEGRKNSPLTVYRHIDPYANRRLPHIIGSEAFLKDDTLGLLDPSEKEEPDDDTISSEDESRTDATPQRGPIVATSSRNEGDEDSDSDEQYEDAVTSRQTPLHDRSPSSLSSSLGILQKQGTSVKTTEPGPIFNGIDSDSDDVGPLFSPSSVAPSKHSHGSSQIANSSAVPSSKEKGVAAASDPKLPTKKASKTTLFDSSDSDADGIFSPKGLSAPPPASLPSHSQTRENRPPEKAVNHSTLHKGKKKKKNLFSSSSEEEEEEEEGVGKWADEEKKLEDERESSILPEEDQRERRSSSSSAKKPVGGISIFGSAITEAIQRQYHPGEDPPDLVPERKSVTPVDERSKGHSEDIRGDKSAAQKQRSDRTAPLPSTDSTKAAVNSLFSDEDELFGGAPSRPEATPPKPPKQSKVNSLFADSEDDELFIPVRSSQPSTGFGSRTMNSRSSGLVHHYPDLPPPLPEDSSPPSISKETKNQPAHVSKPRRGIFDSSSSEDDIFTPPRGAALERTPASSLPRKKPVSVPLSAEEPPPIAQSIPKSTSAETAQKTPSGKKPPPASTRADTPPTSASHPPQKTKQVNVDVLASSSRAPQSAKALDSLFLSSEDDFDIFSSKPNPKVPGPESTASKAPPKGGQHSLLSSDDEDLFANLTTEENPIRKTVQKTPSSISGRKEPKRGKSGVFSEVSATNTRVATPSSDALKTGQVQEESAPPGLPISIAKSDFSENELFPKAQQDLPAKLTETASTSNQSKQKGFQGETPPKSRELSKPLDPGGKKENSYSKKKVNKIFSDESDEDIFSHPSPVKSNKVVKEPVAGGLFSDDEGEDIFAGDFDVTSTPRSTTLSGPDLTTVSQPPLKVGDSSSTKVPKPPLEEESSSALKKVPQPPLEVGSSSAPKEATQPPLKVGASSLPSKVSSQSPLEVGASSAPKVPQTSQEVKTSSPPTKASQPPSKVKTASAPPKVHQPFLEEESALRKVPQPPLEVGASSASSKVPQPPLEVGSSSAQTKVPPPPIKEEKSSTLFKDHELNQESVSSRKQPASNVTLSPASAEPPSVPPKPLTSHPVRDVDEIPDTKSVSKVLLGKGLGHGSIFSDDDEDDLFKPALTHTSASSKSGTSLQGPSKHRPQIKSKPRLVSEAPEEPKTESKEEEAGLRQSKGEDLADGGVSSKQKDLSGMEEDAAEEDPSPVSPTKKPVGGVALFGGKELLSKLKARRRKTSESGEESDLGSGERPVTEQTNSCSQPITKHVNPEDKNALTSPADSNVHSTSKVGAEPSLVERTAKPASIVGRQSSTTPPCKITSSTRTADLWAPPSAPRLVRSVSVETGVSFDEDSRASDILVSVNKSRPRIQHRRRPPSKMRERGGPSTGNDSPDGSTPRPHEKGDFQKAQTTSSRSTPTFAAPVKSASIDILFDGEEREARSNLKEEEFAAATGKQKEGEVVRPAAAGKKKEDEVGRPTSAGKKKEDEVGRPAAAVKKKEDEVGRPAAAVKKKEGEVGRPAATGKKKEDEVGRPAAAGKKKEDEVGKPIATGKNKEDEVGRPIATGKKKEGEVGRPAAAVKKKEDEVGKPIATGKKKEEVGRPAAAGKKKEGEVGKPIATGKNKEDEVGRPTAAGKKKEDEVGRPAAAVKKKEDEVGKPIATGKNKEDEVGKPIATGKKKEEVGRPAAAGKKKEDEVGKSVAPGKKGREEKKSTPSSINLFQEDDDDDDLFKSSSSSKKTTKPAAKTKSVITSASKKASLFDDDDDDDDDEMMFSSRRPLPTTGAKAKAVALSSPLFPDEDAEEDLFSARKKPPKQPQTGGTKPSKRTQEGVGGKDPPPEKRKPVTESRKEKSFEDPLSGFLS